MRFIPVVAALALVFATPALAQQTTTSAPAGNTQKAQGDKAKADKAKADKAKAEKAQKAKSAKENERSNKGGAARGEDRAGAVKEMNNQRKTN